MPLILVTNDDGISSPGIKVLAKVLKDIGDVYVVAPETEQSAVAHALTLHRPLKSLKVGNRTYCVNGTPTDCVIIGVNKILPQKPDIVVSGINNGGNLGDNITYSGTVAAAMEGTLLGIPSLAFSLALEENGKPGYGNISSKFRTAAEHARELTSKALEMGLPEDTLLNVNIPDASEIKGIKVTKQGKLIYDNAIKDVHDPRGKECFWIGGGIPQWESGDNTDLDAVQNGYISVTPVHMNLTNYDALRYIEEHWKI